MNKTNFIEIYESNSKQNSVEVRVSDDNVWLSLNQIAEVFERDKSVISRHLKHIFSTQELDKDSTVAFFATVQSILHISIMEKFSSHRIFEVTFRLG